MSNPVPATAAAEDKQAGNSSSCKRRLLVTVVGFHNYEEVLAYCNQVALLDNVTAFDVEIAVTACGGQFKEFPEVIGKIPVRLLGVGRNLGYLGGV